MSSKTSITSINKQHKNVTSISLTSVNNSNTTSNNKTTAIVKKIQQPQSQAYNKKQLNNTKKTEQKKISATKKKISASAPTTPQHQRRTILPVKARRVQRRKDIVSMTEAIIKVEAESPSFTESDDSTEPCPLPSKKKKNKSKKTMSEVAVITSKSVTTQPLVSRKSKFNDHQVRNRRRSSSVAETRKNVYAGPTFNNAPAPSALPLPAFSPAFLSIELVDDTLEKHSKDLMNILSPEKSSSATVQYQHYREFDEDLSEIQKGLRSMLKI